MNDEIKVTDKKDHYEVDKIVVNKKQKFKIWSIIFEYYI